MKNLYGRNGARHWLSLREGLIVASAIAAAATAQPAHAETLTMICGGYSVAFSPGNLTSHAPKKDRDYPITKVDRQNGRTVVSGKTQYGKITAFFSKDGHSSIVWTNGKDVVLNQCASETVLATQPPPLQEQLVHFYNTRDVYKFNVTSGHCPAGKTEKVDCWPMPAVENTST